MESRVPARLTAREGRVFAFTVGGAFLALTGIVWWREHELLTRVFGGAAALLIVAGLVAPAKLGPVRTAWMALAMMISRVTTPIVMAVLYFLVITPTGLLRRTIGGHPIRHRPVDGSYWHPRAEGARRRDLERQF